MTKLDEWALRLRTEIVTFAEQTRSVADFLKSVGLDPKSIFAIWVRLSSGKPA